VGGAMTQPHHVPLSRLVHDSVQAAYKDLHATMDTLGETKGEKKRLKLLDYAVRTRHRITRLLVAVRWFMDYSAFHQSATIARDSSLARASMYVESADMLWGTAQTTRMAQSVPIVVPPAAEVMMGDGMFARIPKLIETVIDLDLDELSVDSAGEYRGRDATVRLGTVTRQSVLENLPKTAVVIAWRVAPGDSAVRIGHPGVWHADIILDGLLPGDSFFRILRLSVDISADPSAGGPMRAVHRGANASPSSRNLLSLDEVAGLRQLIEDRMYWAVESESYSEETRIADSRGRKMLEALVGVMECEICAQFAMDHVRAQSSWLQLDRAWGSCGLQVDGISHLSDSDSPVVISYWGKSLSPSSVTIRPKLHDSSANLETANGILHVVHDPPLLGVKELTVDITAIDVERFLLRIARARAHKLIAGLRTTCAGIPLEAVKGRIGNSSTQAVSARIAPGCCMLVSISLKTGCWSLRVLGACASAAGGRVLQWSGTRQFSSMNDLSEAVSKSFGDVVAFMRRKMVLRRACAIDLCGMEHYAPGAMSVERLLSPVSPQSDFFSPLLALERYKPRNFLAIDIVESRPESAKAEESIDAVTVDDGDAANPGTASGQSLKRTIMGDELGVVRAKRRRTCGMDFGLSEESVKSDSGNMETASPSALALFVCHWADIEARRRRDELLRMFMELDVITGADGDTTSSPFRTSLHVSAEPLPVLAMDLQVHGDESWEIRLTLLTDLLDDSPLPDGRVRYLSASQTLVFRYSTVSKNAVRHFQHDLMRARAAGILITGILDCKLGSFKVQRRTPSCIELRVHDLRVIVGFVKDGFEIVFEPSKVVLEQHFAPLAEELLNSARHIAGSVLAGLIETSLPIAIAIDRAMPEDAKLWKVAFSSCLRARVVLRGAADIAHALDVDGRVGGGNVMIIDYARALTLSADAAAKRNAVGVNYKPLPRWDALIERLVSTKDGQGKHSGSAVVIPMSILAKVLYVIVDCARKGDRRVAGAAQVVGRRTEQS
jgi:Mediator complex subunit MED14